MTIVTCRRYEHVLARRPGDARSYPLPVIAVLATASVLLGSLVPTADASAGTKPPPPIELLGDGIASVRFGAPQSASIERLEALFGTDDRHPVCQQPTGSATVSSNKYRSPSSAVAGRMTEPGIARPPPVAEL